MSGTASRYAPIVDDMVWSYSRLRSFEQCKHQWYLKYILYANNKAVEPETLFFSEYGKLVHRILADEYRGIITRSEALQIYMKRFKLMKSRAPSYKIYRSYYDSGLNHFLRDLPFSDAKVLGVESEMRWESDGRPFIGYIDLHIENGDGEKELCVIDHKSRTLSQRSKRAKPTKKDLELDEYFTQLYLYSKPIALQYGQFPAKLCFNCFRSGEIIQEGFSKEKYEAANEWARDTISKIRCEEEFAPDIDWFRCKYLCDMHGYCSYYQLNGW